MSELVTTTLNQTTHHSWGEAGVRYCDNNVTPNSSGMGGMIHAIGSAAVVDNDLSLVAVQLPLDQFGYFLNAMQRGFTANPCGSQGNLCFGGGIGRYSSAVKKTGAGGILALELDLTQTPTPTGPVSIRAGGSWYFQCWFRDKNPASTSNFTDGVHVLFL